jgi:energy-coupling factor transporter transmembrane protein EcfT
VVVVPLLELVRRGLLDHLLLDLPVLLLGWVRKVPLDRLLLGLPVPLLVVVLGILFLGMDSGGLLYRVLLL